MTFRRNLFRCVLFCWLLLHCANFSRDYFLPHFVCVWIIHDRKQCQPCFALLRLVCAVAIFHGNEFCPQFLSMGIYFTRDYGRTVVLSSTIGCAAVPFFGFE
jgi:hypothetical protein